MLFEEGELKKILKEKGIKTTGDLNSFMKELTKEVIETLYDGELTDHLGYEKHDVKNKKIDNSRNGYTSKNVKSKHGEISLNTPRDRNAEFSPEIVKKHQKDITGIEEKVISIYALGLSTRDIQAHIEEIYGYTLSPEKISSITDVVIERAAEWQNRPLKPIYPIIFLDAIVVKMRVERTVKNVVIYGIIGIDIDGNKECLGLYLSENAESSKYWLSVMTELANRGVKDIFIFAVDNLSGISDAILSIFPRADIQKCIVHQIRNSLKYVPWKERKEIAGDLKLVYTASTEDEGLLSLDDFEKKWDKKYPHIGRSWRKNWPELSTFFKYSKEIRKLIYTTNPIESFNRSLRKVSKNKSAFPNETAIMKLFYLAVQNIHKKWALKVRDWGRIYSQLHIHYEDRLEAIE